MWIHPIAAISDSRPVPSHPVPSRSLSPASTSSLIVSPLSALSHRWLTSFPSLKDLFLVEFFPLCVSLCFFLCSSICVMAANNNYNRVSFPPGSDSVLRNTTFVQADPSTFRAVVQRLMGVTDSSLRKLPGVLGKLGPRKSEFKLQERRQSLRKLEKKLEAASFVGGGGGGGGGAGPYFSSAIATTSQRSFLEGIGEMSLISPKCFNLHSSSLPTPRSSEPELLPLFPLHSPKDSGSSSY
ncbi:hypothetical protein NE237_032139 [Protea cynaroides]|uniref:VQ domain-containing protein n=1 Tax=Protea cynaroides TaxID=273540 RepID=A0A9Q0L2Q5_9MAGN|nr:hypothetical protein NE237_032139 [Protea cynaroides]